MHNLISRQVAIDACLNGKCANVYDCADAIKALPSAERTGKWIRTGADGYCSLCQCDMPIFREDEDLKFCETDFCPNCGADMRGGE